jgi:F0F1-type ATP synthase assembly protein I
MTQPEKEKYSDQFGRSVRALSDYIGLGLQIAVSFAFFVLLGYWADGKLGTSPLFLLAGVVVGMGGMVLVLMKVVRNADRKKGS